MHNSCQLKACLTRTTTTNLATAGLRKLLIYIQIKKNFPEERAIREKTKEIFISADINRIAKEFQSTLVIVERGKLIERKC